jgi:hypothetical protein
VSKSGFSDNALAQVSYESGRVQALTPEIVDIDGQAVVKRFYMDAIDYSANGCRLYVSSSITGEHILVDTEAVTDIYGQDGKLLGPLIYLVEDILGLEPLRMQFALQAHNHPEKNAIRTFSSKLRVSELQYHIQRTDTGDLYLIDWLEMWGDFKIWQTEIPLILTKLGGRVYGAAEAPIMNRPAVWVGTTDQQANTTTISWQTTDSSSPLIPPAPQPPRPIHFPEILALVPIPAQMNPDTEESAGHLDE